MINKHGHRASRVVDQFEATDLGAPFKVILKNSVKVVSDEKTGELISYTIPDPDGLLRTVAFARVLHARKLSGADIRFLRKAVGVKQRELAKAIEIQPEHLSRVEAATTPLGPGSEKLARIFLAKTAYKHQHLSECAAKKLLEGALDRLFDSMHPVAAHDATDDLVLCFMHRSALRKAHNDGAEEGAWADLAA